MNKRRLNEALFLSLHIFINANTLTIRSSTKLSCCTLCMVGAKLGNLYLKTQKNPIEIIYFLPILLCLQTKKMSLCGSQECGQQAKRVKILTSFSSFSSMALDLPVLLVCISESQELQQHVSTLQKLLAYDNPPLHQFSSIRCWMLFSTCSKTTRQL